MDVCSRFSSVTIQPAYGSQKVLVTWTMKNPADITGEFYLYRSADGVNWTDEPVNEGSPVTGASFYVDDAPFPVHQTEQLYYRILWQNPLGDEESDSGPVYVWEDMRPEDYGVIRTRMNDDYLFMVQAKRGVKLRLLRPKTRGERCPTCFDPHSHTHYQQAICQTCYGTGYKGGYGSPMTIWGISTEAQVTNMRETGSDNVVSRRKSFQLMAYPLLSPHDVLVVPRTDDRYVVGDDGATVWRYLDRYPVGQKVTTDLAARGNIIYSVPVT